MHARRLDVVLELGDLVLQLVERDELILDDERDLQLADAVADLRASVPTTRPNERTGTSLLLPLPTSACANER